MANISLRVDIVKDLFPGMPGKLQRGLQAAVLKAAHDVEAGAKARSRVDTGQMRNGWQTRQIDELSAEVFNPVEHAVYNEYGTVHMSAQPMAHPAADAAKPGFEAAVRQVVEGLV